jgi:tetratricopeptide (TPR) repeat protein
MVARDDGALEVMQEGLFETADLWPSIRLELATDAPSWEFGERPPEEQLETNRFLLDLAAPCFGDKVALLSGLLWDQKASQPARLALSTLQRPGLYRNLLTPWTWPKTHWMLIGGVATCLLMGFLLAAPARGEETSWRKRLLVSSIVVAAAPLVGRLMLETLQPLLPPPFDPFIPGFREPIVVLIGLFLIPLGGLTLLGLGVLEIDKLRWLQLKRWSHYAISPGIPVGAMTLGLWLVDRVQGFGLFLDNSSSATWLCLPIASFMGALPLARLSTRYSIEGEPGRPLQIGLAISGLLVLAGIPFAIGFGSLPILIGITITSIPGAIGSLFESSNLTLEKTEQPTAKVGSTAWIAGLPDRDAEVLAMKINPVGQPVDAIPLFQLRGDAGCGKTRLVDEACQRLLALHPSDDPPILILKTHARELPREELAAAKALLAQVLGTSKIISTLNSQQQAAGLQQEVGGNVEAVLALLPVVGPILGLLNVMNTKDIEEADTKGPSEVRRALLNLFGNAAVRVAKKYSGFLIVLQGDDPGVLDAPSQDFIGDLLREWPRLFPDAPPLFVVVVGQGDPTTHKPGPWSGLEVNHPIQVLGPIFHSGDISLIAGSRGFSRVQPVAAKQLLEWTEGNLEALLEYLDWLKHRLSPGNNFELTPNHLRDHPLPPELLNRVARKWNQMNLSENDRWWIECAACLGHKFHVADLASLVKTSELLVARWTERLGVQATGPDVTTPLFRDVTTEDGYIQFIQRTLQRSLSENQDPALQQKRLEFERRIASTLWARLVDGSDLLPDNSLPSSHKVSRHLTSWNRLARALEYLQDASDPNTTAPYSGKTAWAQACAGIAALGRHEFSLGSTHLFCSLGFALSESKNGVSVLVPIRGVEVATLPLDLRNTVYTKLVDLLLLLDKEDLCTQLVEHWREELRILGDPSHSLTPCLLQGSLAKGRARDNQGAREWALEAIGVAEKNSLDALEAQHLAAWSAPRKAPNGRRDQLLCANAITELNPVILSLAQIDDDPETTGLGAGEIRRARSILAKAYNTRAELQGQPEKKMRDIEHSIALKTALGDTVGLAYSYGAMARTYQYKQDAGKEDLQTALAWWNKDLEVVEAIGDIANCTQVRSQIGDMLSRLGKPEEGRRRFEESIALAESSGNDENIAFAAFGLAMHLFWSGEATDSLNYLCKAVEAFCRWNNALPGRSWRWDASAVEGGGAWTHAEDKKLPDAPWRILLWGALQEKWEMNQPGEGVNWPENPYWPDSLSDRTKVLREMMARGTLRSGSNK